MKLRTYGHAMALTALEECVRVLQRAVDSLQDEGATSVSISVDEVRSTLKAVEMTIRVNDEEMADVRAKAEEMRK